MTLPILYSLRNCPYAMRARLAIFKSRQSVELRDVVLKHKPPALIAASPKATVPVLVLASSKVIDESLDIMLWALAESDPHNLLPAPTPHNQVSLSDVQLTVKLDEILNLIHIFDTQFKPNLESYKCAKRYHESNITTCRQACEVYLQTLEKRLSEHAYLMDENESMADIALLPFIRQFAKVERQWYLQSPYPNVKRWLTQYLQSVSFTKVMAKHPIWSEGQALVRFGDI